MNTRLTRHSRTGRSRIFRVAALAAVVTVVLALTTGLAAPGARAVPNPVGELAGKTVFLDPGHQGSAAGHDLSKQVPDGRGGTKDCQTAGATAVTGKAEHTINWEVAQLVKAALEAKGARVVLSRADDTGWGGCVDERARAANDSRADIAVSLHADSTAAGNDASKSGFHLIVPVLPVPDATVTRVQGTEGRKATEKMRDSFKAAGFAPANYGGIGDGIVERTDIAGANLTQVPLVFVEMGNLSNPEEARKLSSPEGATAYALAVTNGITSYVTGNAVVPDANPQIDPNAPVAPVPPAPEETNPNGTVSPEDFTGLGDVGALIGLLASATSLQEAQDLLLLYGSDVSSEALRAMLAVVYAVFGGKLPV